MAQCGSLITDPVLPLIRLPALVGIHRSASDPVLIPEGPQRGHADGENNDGGAQGAYRTAPTGPSKPSSVPGTSTLSATHPHPLGSNDNRPRSKATWLRLKPTILSSSACRTFESVFDCVFIKSSEQAKMFNIAVTVVKTERKARYGNKARELERSESVRQAGCLVSDSGHW
ncbi:hypothetical protein PtB15_7B428 [Puccinia triticina]|nr:hypothetical protein PtB15_7B428 [Puccinia triticina]